MGNHRSPSKERNFSGSSQKVVAKKNQRDWKHERVLTPTPGGSSSKMSGDSFQEQRQASGGQLSGIMDLGDDWILPRTWMNQFADSSPATPVRMPVLQTPWVQACGTLNRRPTQAYQTSDLHKLWGNRFVLFSSPNLVGSCYGSERQQIALLQEAGITWSHQDSAKSLAQHESDALTGGSLGVAESRGSLLHLFSSQLEHSLPLNSRYYYNNYKATNKINSNS